MQTTRKSPIGQALLGLGVVALVLDTVNVLYLKFLLGVPFLVSAVNPLIDAIGIVGIVGLITGLYLETKET